MAGGILQRKVLQLLEQQGECRKSEVVGLVDAADAEVRDAIVKLEERNLVAVDSTMEDVVITCETPIPFSEIAFREGLTPTQAIIRYLYEERGYGQTRIARLLDYSPGNIQTNLERIEDNQSEQ